jgi:hypothetical protein
MDHVLYIFCHILINLKLNYTYNNYIIKKYIILNIIYINLLKCFNIYIKFKKTANF